MTEPRTSTARPREKALRDRRNNRVDPEAVGRAFDIRDNCSRGSDGEIRHFWGFRHIVELAPYQTDWEADQPARGCGYCHCTATTDRHLGGQVVEPGVGLQRCAPDGGS